MKESKNIITSRKVFYLGGFDPRGARFYHNLYKEELTKQAKITGAKFEVSKRKKSGKHISKWDISLEENDIRTETEYNFLEWDDFVRKHWIKNPFILTLLALTLYSSYFLSGAIFKIYNMSKGVVTVMLYPLFFLFLISIPPIFLASFISNIFISITLFTISFYYLSKLEKFLNVFWLLRIYLFCSSYGFLKNKDLSDRADGFSDLISQELKAKTCDEVLIIGHSVGATLLTSVIAKIFKKHREEKAKIKIITLGHCLPATSFLPWAKNFKQELKIISERRNIYWLDVTSGVDGACTPKNLPFDKINNSPKAHVKKISPRFHKMFEASEYKKIKKNKFRIHFQYIIASEKKTDYDYFKITAGSNNFLNNFDSK